MKTRLTYNLIGSPSTMSSNLMPLNELQTSLPVYGFYSYSNVAVSALSGFVVTLKSDNNSNASKWAAENTRRAFIPRGY